MTEAILAFMAATAVLAISPGPDNIYVLMQSVANGTGSGIATTAGLITGCIIHTTLIAFGVSTLITTVPILFTVIKVIGAIYLLYLAYKVYLADSRIELGKGAPKKSYIALFKQGILMNVLNPKVTIFFLAFFPGFLWAPEGNLTYQFYTLGAIFMIESFLIFGSIALVAGQIAPFLHSSDIAGLVLKWLQIVVFVGISIFILL